MSKRKNKQKWLRKHRNKIRREAINKRLGSPRPDDYFDAGHFTLKRFGNRLLFEGASDDSKRLEAIEEVRAEQPKYKNKVDLHISSLVQLFSQYDALDLITPICLERSVRGYSERQEDDDNSDKMLADLDYLHGLLLSCPGPKAPVAPSPTEHQRVFELMDALRNDIGKYYVGEAVLSRAPLDERVLRLKVILASLNIRGTSYWPVAGPFWLKLFASHDQYMRDHFGFTASDLKEAMEAFESKILERVNEATSTIRTEFQSFTENLEAWRAANGIPKGKIGTEEFAEFARESPPVESASIAKIRSWLAGCGGKATLNVIPADEQQLKLLERLSSGYGDDTGFLEPKEYERWPLNKSMVPTRPFVRIENSYYLPNPSFAFQCFRETLESLIQESAPKYYERKYVPSRHVAVLGETFESFGRLFGEDAVYQNLFYRPQGALSNAELDALVVYGDALLFIEVKAGGLAPSARRGGTRRIIENLGKLIGDAYEQGDRAIQYLMNSENAAFYDESGKELVRLSPGDFNHVFIINITLEQLWSLAVNQDRSICAAIRVGDRPLWSISLPDFLVTLQVLDRPSLFLSYLQRRAELRALPTVESNDELDLLMYFVERGLWKKDSQLVDGDKVIIGDHTGVLNSYYNRVAAGLPAERPRIVIPGELNELIKQIENNPGCYGVSCMLKLLETDDETRANLSSTIKELGKRAATDHKTHTALLKFETHGILLCACTQKAEMEELTERLNSASEKWGLACIYGLLWGVPLAKSEVLTNIFRQPGRMGRKS